MLLILPLYPSKASIKIFRDDPAGFIVWEIYHFQVLQPRMLSILAVGGNLEKTQKMEKKETVRLNKCFWKTYLGAASFQTHLFNISLNKCQRKNQTNKQTKSMKTKPLKNYQNKQWRLILQNNTMDSFMGLYRQYYSLIQIKQ